MNQVRGIGKTFDTLGTSIYDEVDELYEKRMVNSLTPWSASSTQDSDSHYPKAEKIPSRYTLSLPLDVWRILQYTCLEIFPLEIWLKGRR